MDPFDLIILTDNRYVNPSVRNDYIDNILTEDSLAAKALDARGLKVGRKSWADPAFDWANTRYALFRTTWDYHEKFDEFIRWMGRASRSTKLINPFKLTQWNLDKHYLLDLERKGIPVVPTNFIKPLTKTTLQVEVDRRGWADNAVLKPSISASARHTYRLKPHNIPNHEAIFQRLIRMESLMIQPFMESVIRKGEVSLIVINGKYSHAILKKAKFGDFRVQDEFGGSTEMYEPSLDEISLAEKAVAACPYFPIYARVDVVRNETYDLLVSELELIEPELFFRNKPEAADLLADAIVEHMSS